MSRLQTIAPLKVLRPEHAGRQVHVGSVRLRLVRVDACWLGRDGQLPDSPVPTLRAGPARREICCVTDPVEDSGDLAGRWVHPVTALVEESTLDHLTLAAASFRGMLDDESLAEWERQLDENGWTWEMLIAGQALDDAIAAISQTLYDITDQEEKL